MFSRFITTGKMKTDNLKNHQYGRGVSSPLPLSSCEKSLLFANKYFVFAVFTVFMAIIALTAFSVPLFGDDYYYAYFVKAGGDFFVSENVVHYMQTNGRALVHILDELLLGFGILPWRIFVVMTVGITVLLSAKCISGVYGKGGAKCKKHRYAVLLSCAAFSALTLPVLRQSVWWATGSLNYLFPTALLLLLWCLLEKSFVSEAKPGALSYIALAAVALFCGMSTEQASFGTVVICLWFTFRSLIEKRKFRPIYPICAAFAVIGFVTLYFAPGNAIRTTYYPEFYSMSLFEKIAYNSDTLLNVALGDEGMYTSVIAALLGFAALKLSNAFSKNDVSKVSKAVNIVMASVTVLTAAVYVSAVSVWEEYFFDISSVNKTQFTILLTTLAVSAVIILADSFIRLIKKKEQTFIFYSGAIVLQLAMLVSPQFGSRTVFISAILLFIAAFRDMASSARACQSAALGLFATAVTAVAYFHGHSGVWAVLLFAVATCIMILLLKKIPSHSLAVIATVAVCFCGLWRVYEGYAENYEIHQQNEAIVSEYLLGDMTEDTLYLYYPRNNTHRYTMPYDNEYHMFRYKELYGIPSLVELVYIPHP